MSESKSNESFPVAADVLVGNVLQQEPASYLPTEKLDNSKKIVLKNQKTLKMKSMNDVDDKMGNAATAAENNALYGNNDSSVNGNSNNSTTVTNTPTSSASTPINSTYFGNRSNTNINGVKKSFEKRYNSISFSPNVNLHSSVLNSSPILKPKKTLHVTNFTMNKCALRNLLLSFSGFKTVAFYQDYCFVVFADIESATAAAEQLLAKTKLKVNFSKADYIPNVVSPSSIGNPNSILHVTNYPTSTTEAEMIEMYSSYPGYLHIHFSKNFSLVYYQDIASAKNVLQHMNQTTNFTTIYSIKNANNSPINMNNNYHNNVPNGPPPPFNPMMNNGYRNMGVNGGLVMANGYPPPPVSATAPATSNFNANGVINHPHNVSPNVPHNNGFIKYNNSSNNLAGMTNNVNVKGMNGFGMPPSGASNNYGFNNPNPNINNGPLKMNSIPNNSTNNMNYFNGMSKPISLSPNMDNNSNKNFNNPYKNQNIGLRKQSEGNDLSAQLLNLNISRGIMNKNKDDDSSNDINDMIKNSLIQSKSDSNLNGLINRKDSVPLMTSLENNNNSSSKDNTNNTGMGSNANSPFFKKSSIYDDMNNLKPSNSNQLLSAGNYGMDRNEYMTSRKLSNASSILMENNQNNNGYSNYPNKKYMVPPDVTITPDYSNIMKGNGYNSMLPMQNYGNYPNPQLPIQKDSNKVNINDPKDIFNQMNYSDMNDPNSIFSNLNRTLSDSALSQTRENETVNSNMTINSSDKLHPSIQLNNGTNDLSMTSNNLPPNGNNSSSFNIGNINNEKLSFMPLSMGGHGNVLNANNNEGLRPNTLKQHSLSSIDLLGMKNLYNDSYNVNNGSINSSNFSNQLLKTSKSELPFVPQTQRSNSTPYIDFNGGNNVLSANLTNTSFTNLNAFPSILNKSKSFCTINSLNNDSNKNPNDVSFSSIFSNDKKDSNSSLDGGLLMKNSYGVESPKSMYEPGLKNLRVNDLEYEGGQDKSKSVGIIGESKTTESKNNDSLDTDLIKVNNNNLSVKDISSSYSDSSVNENDFIEFIASKRQDTSKEKLKADNATSDNNNNSTNELETKDMNNSNSHKSSISSSTSPTFIYSPIYNEKSDLSIDEVIFNANGKVSSSSSSTQINTKLNNLSYSTLVNNSGNESFLNTIKNLSPTNYDDSTGNKKVIKEISSDENKSNNEALIKQLYAKIEQLQKENNELSQTRDYHLFLISKLENQLEVSRTENNNLKEQLNRL